MQSLLHQSLDHYYGWSQLGLLSLEISRVKFIPNWNKFPEILAKATSSSSRAGSMKEHSHFHGSLPLFTILGLSPCRVQKWFAYTTLWVSRKELH